MRNRTLVALAAALVSLSVNAADYYVVMPVKGKTLNVSAIDVVLAQSSLPGAVVGAAYSYDFKQNLQVTGDPAYSGYGVKWAVSSGALPAGLTLNTDTGVLSGTPASSGVSSVGVSATYKTKSGTQVYQVATVDIVVSLASAVLPAAVTGVGYAGYDFKSLLSASGDPAFTSSAATWSLTSGALPDGLTLSSTGVVSGSPTTAGSAGFSLRASYRGRSASQNYLIAVDQASVVGSLTANTDTNYGSVSVGSSALRSFSFTNNGNAPATGFYATVAGSYMSLSANTCGTVGSPITLGNGATCTITAQYAPTAGHTLAGNVSVAWAGPNAGSSNLTLSGSAVTDYSSLMAGFTRDPVAIVRNSAWAAGQWYWVVAGAEYSAPVATYEFRRVITVSGTSNITAYIYGAVDNTLASVGVNGSQVLTSVAMNYKNLSASGTFTLVPGVNVVSITVVNSGASANPAGFTLQVKQQDGTVLATEAGWKY